MSKILTQDEIDALLRNVAASQTYEPTVETRERPVHLYDFKHPDRISKDQLRALRTINDAFARSFGTYLSSMLRTLVDINLLSIDQATYSEYMLSLSVPSCLHIFTSKNLKGSAILEIAPQFALTVVDRLLGGSGTRVGTPRELTIIEQNILRKMIDSCLTILADAWRHAYQMNTYVESYESNPQFVQIAPASETAVVVSFEIVLRDTTYPMNVCAPYFVLEPLIQNLSTSWSNVGTKKATQSEVDSLRMRVGLTTLPVAAQLGSVPLSTTEIIGLRKGDVVRLRQRNDEFLRVWVDGKVKFWAEAGMSGQNRAFKIVRRVTDMEEINFE
jgi:flagellar motor switch protein FliM